MAKITKTLADGKTKTYEYDYNWSDYRPTDGSLSIRLDDSFTALLDKESNKTEFVIDALQSLYGTGVWIDCPSCKGSGQFYTGNNKKPKKMGKPRNVAKRDYTGKKVHTFNCGKELKDKLKKEIEMTETVKQAIMLAYSKQRIVTCPTCKGAGKILGAP